MKKLNQIALSTVSDVSRFYQIRLYPTDPQTKFEICVHKKHSLLRREM